MPQYRVLDTLKHGGQKYKAGALLDLTPAQAKAMAGLVKKVEQEQEKVEKLANHPVGDEAKKKSSRDKAQGPVTG